MKIKISVCLLSLFALTNVYGITSSNNSNPVADYPPPSMNQGGVVIYPGYPGGEYLYPGEVKPGEDEADAIYRANQRPGE